MKIAYLICLFVITPILINAQLTETFKGLDSKHRYKDIVFGTMKQKVATKMGLIRSARDKTANTYLIKVDKYLTARTYTENLGFVTFSGDKLMGISLYANLHSLPFGNVLEYFTELFGTYEAVSGLYRWVGDNIIYAITHVQNDDEYLITIASRIVKRDNGADNF